MSVQRCSIIQNSFATMQKMAEVEVAHFRGRTIRGIISGTVCAIQLRISAVVYGAIWAAKEVFYAVPQLINIAIKTIRQRTRDEGVGQTFSKIIHLWSNKCRTQILQGLGYIAGATVPELLYACDAEKIFYHHHIQAFVNSLADFPSVDNVLFGNFGPDILEPMAKLWLDLGLTNTDFKEIIKQTLRKSDKKEAYERFNETSFEFVKLLFDTLNEKLITWLKEEIREDSLTPKKLQALKPLYFIMMYSKLSTREREKIFEIRPELEDTLEMHTDEVNFYYASIYHKKFRPPQVVAFSNLLLLMMESVKNQFVRDEVFSVDDVECYDSTAYSAILCHGIYHLIEQAQLTDQGELMFSARRSRLKSSTLKNDQQMYGAKPQLVALYKEIKMLATQQEEALLQLLQFKEDIEIQDPLVRSCYIKIVDVRHALIEKYIMKNDGLCDEAQTPWDDAFICTPL